MASINTIPFEMLENVLSNLPFFDLVRSQLVCQRWRAVFLLNEKKWHYNKVTERNKDGETTRDVHQLLTLFSGSGTNSGKTCQLTAIAEGRTLSKVHIYALDNENLLGLARSNLQRLLDLTEPNAQEESQSMDITEEQILNDSLFKSKFKYTGDCQTPDMVNFKEERVFFDWMQSFELGLTWQKDELITYSTTGSSENFNPEAFPSTTLIIARFCFLGPRYEGMKVGEFIEDVWNETKSLVWKDHKHVFPKNHTSFITIALRKSRFDGKLRVWVLA